jgi:hypothetical protein
VQGKDWSDQTDTHCVAGTFMPAFNASATIPHTQSPGLRPGLCEFASFTRNAYRGSRNQLQPKPAPSAVSRAISRSRYLSRPS